MKKNNFEILLVGIFLVTACGGTALPTQAGPVPVEDPSATASISKATATPTVSVTLLPAITSTSNEPQPNPFPSETPNPTARAIAKRWNAGTVLLSPDGSWAAIANQGILHIIQTQGDKELSVKCDIFTVCEFVVPIQWSTNNRMLYIASLLTGESDVPFPQYTGIARIDPNTGNLEKMIEDSSAESEYSLSLSPDGNYLAFTEIVEQQPSLGIVNTETLEKIVVQRIDHGAAAGNILWRKEAEKIVFVALINCESSVYSFDLKTKTLSVLIERDPTCIELLFINEQNQVAFSRTTYHPFSKSYWYLDLGKGEVIPAVSATPEP